MGYNEPEYLTAGDTWGWKRSYGETIFKDSSNNSTYCKASTWTLTYHFVCHSPENKFSITAAATDDDYLITSESSMTSQQSTGIYYWSAYVSQGTTRHEVDSGRLEILPNMAKVGAGHDLRSHWVKTYEAVKELVEGRTPSDVLSYTIGGRSITRIAITELSFWLAQYESRYNNEISQELIKAKKETKHRILSRL